MPVLTSVSWSLCDRFLKSQRLRVCEINLAELFAIQISFKETKQLYYPPFLKQNPVKSTDLLHKLPSNEMIRLM